MSQDVYQQLKDIYHVTSRLLGRALPSEINPHWGAVGHKMNRRMRTQRLVHTEDGLEVVLQLQYSLYCVMTIHRNWVHLCCVRSEGKIGIISPTKWKPVYFLNNFVATTYGYSRRLIDNNKIWRCASQYFNGRGCHRALVHVQMVPYQVCVFQDCVCPCFLSVYSYSPIFNCLRLFGAGQEGEFGKMLVRFGEALVQC